MYILPRALEELVKVKASENLKALREYTEASGVVIMRCLLFAHDSKAILLDKHLRIDYQTENGNLPFILFSTDLGNQVLSMEKDFEKNTAVTATI